LADIKWIPFVIWFGILGISLIEMPVSNGLPLGPGVIIKPNLTNANQAEQGAGEKPDNRTRWMLPVEVFSGAKSAADITREQTSENEKTANDRALTFATQIIAIFTIGLVMVAAVQAGLFWVQLRYMRDGMQDAKTAAEAAKTAAHAATTANNQSREFFIADTRPWLILSVLEIAVSDSDDQIALSIAAKNIGKSPAIGVDLRIEVKYTNVFFQDPLYVEKFSSSIVWEKENHRFQKTIFPNDSIKLFEYADFAIEKWNYIKLIYCVVYKISGADNLFRSGGEIFINRGQLIPADDAGIDAVDVGTGSFSKVAKFTNSGVTFAD
jgi:hypothetical protein